MIAGPILPCPCRDSVTRASACAVGTRIVVGAMNSALPSSPGVATHCTQTALCLRANRCGQRVADTPHDILPIAQRPCLKMRIVGYQGESSRSSNQRKSTTVDRSSHRFSQGAGKMRDGGVDADHQVQLSRRGSGSAKSLSSDAMSCSKAPRARSRHRPERIFCSDTKSTPSSRQSGASVSIGIERIRSRRCEGLPSQTTPTRRRSLRGRRRDHCASSSRVDSHKGVVAGMESIVVPSTAEAERRNLEIKGSKIDAAVHHLTRLRRTNAPAFPGRPGRGRSVSPVG